MEIQLHLIQDSAGTLGSGTYEMTVPLGLSIDTNIHRLTADGAVSNLPGYLHASTGTGAPAIHHPNGSTTTTIRFQLDGANTYFGSTSTPNFSTTTLRLSAYIELNIAEWANSTNSGLVGFGIASASEYGLVKMNPGATTSIVPEYETGTWTPSQASGVSNFSGTAVFGAATYTKIGRMVFAQIFDITGLVATTSGNTCLYHINTTGLPGITNTTTFNGSAYTTSANGPIAAAITDVSSLNTAVGLYWDSNVTGGGITIASIGFWYIAS
jgi:hypothetical protein